MDSSNRVELLTRGPRIRLAEFTAEEKVEVVLYWLRQLKGFFKYLPVLKPLHERLNTGYRAEGRERRTTEQVCWFDNDISDRLKVAGASQVEYAVVWPEGRHGPTFADPRNPDRDVKERNLLLTEDGVFLLEEVEYKLQDGFGHKGRGQLEDVSSYRVRFVSQPELVSLEQENSFFQGTIWWLMDCLRKVGQQKVEHGQVFLARAEEMAAMFRSLILSEPV